MGNKSVYCKVSSKYFSLFMDFVKKDSNVSDEQMQIYINKFKGYKDSFAEYVTDESGRSNLWCLTKKQLDKSSVKFKPFINDHWYPCVIQERHTTSNAVLMFDSGAFSNGKSWAKLYKPSELIIGKSIGKIDFPDSQ